MNMKKILFIAALGIIAASASSCRDDFFGQYPSNNITEGNFYQTESDFNQGVYSCYAKLKTESGFFISELGFRSDESYLESMAVSTQDRYDLDHFAENASNGILRDVWNAWYNGIYRCNDVLDHMLTTSLDTQSEKMKQYKGECLFIRSWYNINLYKTFGVVPLINKVVSPTEAMTIPRCTDQGMLERLKEDLTEAIELLPEKRPAEKARVSKIAARALLGQVYLTFKMYPDAKKVLADALSDAGYGLMENTAAAFNVTNKMNKEIIFALCYNKGNDFGHGYWWSSNTNVEADRHVPTVPTKSLFDTEKDNRWPLIHDFIKITSSVYAMPKWYDTYDATYTTQVGNDYPLLRYADVVLMYAEALGLGGDIAGALPYINQTRTRAGLNPLTSAEVASEAAFRQQLADERGREFAYEGKRWFDLVRLGLAVDYFTKLGYKIDNHELVLPIPQNQIEIYNNDAVLWQNPGY